MTLVRCDACDDRTYRGQPGWRCHQCDRGQYQAVVDDEMVERAANNAAFCRFPECAYEQEAYERLRKAARAVVDAVAFYDSTLTTAYRNEQRPHVMETARALRVALESSPEPKEEP